MDNNSKTLLFNLLKQYQNDKYRLFQAKKAILVRTEFIVIPKKYAITMMAHENGIEDGKFRIEVTLSVDANESASLRNLRQGFVNKILEKYKGSLDTNLQKNVRFTNGKLHFIVWDKDKESAVKYLNNVFSSLETLAKTKTF